MNVRSIFRSTKFRWIVLLFLLLSVRPALADASKQTLAEIPFTRQVLDNGLTVLYIPMHNAPVVHVRVIYHVGSRDEKPDRQGFAHMFEHMMFRGSAHIAPEEHMKLIGIVGGESNAFTQYDQTAYVDTLPSSNLQMALYLEADRMSSFKVNDNIFKTERAVVSEEWRMRYANQPYGSMFEDFVKTAYTTHPYRWTPIGNMDQLREASSSELQEFFNKFYIPNNACLVICGDFQLDQAEQWVNEYFDWIPRGDKIIRTAVPEPPQTAPRKLVAYKSNIQLTAIDVGWKTTRYASDDHYALGILASILGDGETGRLQKALVNNDKPLCLDVDSFDYQLQDAGMFINEAHVLPGKDEAAVEQTIKDSIQNVIDHGVTQEELDKAKTTAWINLIHERETAKSLGGDMGEEQVFGGDANRINEEWPKISALTPADIQAVAKKYLQPDAVTTVVYLPDPLRKHSRSPATLAIKAEETKNAPVAPSTEPIKPRVTEFPPGYPTKPPFSDKTLKVTFDKGVKTNLNGVKVIVMPDHRLPLVNFSFVMRSGGYAEPKGKEGLASLTADMLRRGVKGMDYLTLSQDLESRGIDLGILDDGDNTRLTFSCTADQVDHAIERAHQILTEPTFPADEFAKLKAQTIGGLMSALNNPTTVGPRDLSHALYGDSPLGRQSTPASVASITLDDVKNWYAQVYKPNDAIFIISGDIDPDHGQKLAETLLAGMTDADHLPQADYTLPAPTDHRQIILVDNPDGRQSTMRMGIRAYDLSDDAEKWAGSLASHILSDGIDSRLNKYVRAEKGFTYGCYGYFMPSRHAGDFDLECDTNPATTGPCIDAILKVLNDMRTADVTPEELRQAKTRVAGGMVMEMQTIAQQASRRIDVILNHYPIDYFDVYPQRIAQVTADQVRDVMNKYVQDTRMTLVIVAPASTVKGQLTALGNVQVLPMPLNRPGVSPTTAPSQEMLKDTQ